MTKVLGIFLMFLVLLGMLLASDPNARSIPSLQNTGLRVGTLGILVLAVAPVIIAGGIDLSIGSVLVLSGISFVLLMKYGLQLTPWSPYLIVPFVLLTPGFFRFLVQVAGYFRPLDHFLLTRFHLHPLLAKIGAGLLVLLTAGFLPLGLFFRDVFHTRFPLSARAAALCGFGLAALAVVLVLLVAVSDVFLVGAVGVAFFVPVFLYAHEAAVTRFRLFPLLAGLGAFGVAALYVGLVLLLLTSGVDLPPFSPYVAILVVFLAMAGIGLLHGRLITQLRLQPFLVTLCGLFIARGLARLNTRQVTGATGTVSLSGIPFDLTGLDFLVQGRFQGLPWVWAGAVLALGLGLLLLAQVLNRLTPDQKAVLRWVGLGLLALVGLDRLIVWSAFAVPWPLVLMLGLAVVLGVFLHATVFGRYLYAIGANEQAARYAGIATDRYKVLTYLWCSVMTAVGGILFILENGGANPATDGNFYELYAITGAVLGGCSLRGGEGAIVGIVLGAAILPLLRKIILFAGVPDDVEFAVVGLALLLGTIVDEALKRRAAAARA